MNAPAVVSRDDYRQAEGMSLRCTASSVQAVGFVETVLDQLVWPVAASYRPTTAERRRTAVRALMADLMRLEAKGSVGFHGMSLGDFNAKVMGFGRDVFISVKDALVAAGLLTYEGGWAHWMSFANVATGAPGQITQHGGRQARFGLTRKALDDAEAAGVVLAAWDDHWARPAPLQAIAGSAAPLPPLVELRGTKEQRGAAKMKGLNVPFDSNASAVRRIVEDLQAHNGYMRDLGVSGVDFIGLRRIFNNGDMPGYAWDQGGRFYSLRAPGMGPAYETLPGEERRDRILIGGERVAEVDMSASQLRLLYALLDEPIPAGLEEDLYALPGVQRQAVKLIVTQAIGRESTKAKRWGPEALREYKKAHKGRSLQEDHPFAPAHTVTCRTHIVLERLTGVGVITGLGLQYVESEVIRRAMGSLREGGIGSLPVHDSLIVPAKHLAEAEEALQLAFKMQVANVLDHPTQHRAWVKLKEPGQP